MYEGGDTGSGKGPEDLKLTPVDRLDERKEVRGKDEHFSWRNWEDGVAVPEMGILRGPSFRDCSGVPF